MQALKVKNFKSGFAGLAPLRARPGLASGRLRPLPIRATGLLTGDMQKIRWLSIVKIPLFHRKVSFIHILATSFPQFVTSAKADLHLIVYNSIYYAELCRLGIF